MGNLSKLKTNLKIAVQRLKLLEKKKSENAKKATKEIADYLSNSKQTCMTLYFMIPTNFKCTFGSQTKLTEPKLK